MEELLYLLHLSGGTFPTGAFSQSWGLETYLHQGRIQDEKGFREFLGFYIDSVLGGLEGPVFCATYDLASSDRLEALPEVEEQFSAMRLTRETREAGWRTGKSFLRILAETAGDERIKAYYEAQRETGISFPVAFGLASALRGADKGAALRAFFFSTANGIVQSGIKLIPLGNVQAQQILMDFYQKIEEASCKAMRTPLEEAFAFYPGLDIASMEHETLATRLYMS